MLMNQQMPGLKVNYKKSELKTFCNKMELVESQYRNVEKAFTLNTGPFAVSNDYAEYRENPVNWVKQSESYKQKVLSKIHKLPISLISCQLPSVSISSNTGDTYVPLSVSFEDAEMPAEVFKDMWVKVVKLVADSDE